MSDVTLLRMKYKHVHSCQFVHHAKICCIIAVLDKLIKTEFEIRDWKRAKKLSNKQCMQSSTFLLTVLDI